MNLSKKIIGIILSVLMIVSVIPMAAFANEAVATKSAADISVDDEYICGLNAEGTQFADVKAQFANPDDVTATSDTYIGTGAVFTIGAETRTAILFGDVNGDGAIDGFDLLLVDKDINDIAKLDGIFAIAGDTDDDGAVDLDDYKEIVAQIAGEKLVDQRKALPKITVDEADAAAIGTVTAADSESITPDAAFDLKVNQTAADIAEARYADWTVDLILTFNKDVKAEDVYLLGSYGAYDWQGANLTGAYSGTIAAGNEISILGDWLNAGTITYRDLVEFVQDFQSAIYVKDAADGLKATVKLIMIDDDNTARTIDTFEYTWLVLPTHNFTEVPTNTVGNNGVVTGIASHTDVAVDTAVELTTDITAADIADKSYKDWIVDFKLTFNKDVSTEDVYVFGDYGPYNWVGDALKYTDSSLGATLTANSPVRLLGDAVNYKDLADIQDFKCAIYVNNPVDGLTATLELVMIDPDNNEYVLDTYTYTWVVPVLPTVEIVDGSTVGEINTGSETITPDVGVEIDFNETYAEVLEKEYADYATDVIVTFNKSLNADDVYFFGKYGTSGWLGGALTGQTIDADNPFSLVDWYLAGTSYAGQDLPYKEVLKRVSGGEAALYIDGDTTGLVVSVKIVITDENGVETVLKEDSYEYIAKPNVDIVEPEVVIPGGEIPYAGDVIEPDTAVVVSFNETYDDIQDNEYKDWTADIIVTFNKDLNAEDVYFFGQYGDSGWLGGALEGQTITANQAISLVNWFLGGTAYSPSDVTYEEVLKRITTDAKAALYIEDAAAKAGLVVNVQMVLKDDQGNVKVLEEGKYEFIATPNFQIVDGSTVGTINTGSEVITPDTAVNVQFTETYADVQDKEYKDWKADVVVSFNKDLDSSKVFFYGKYGASGWMGGNLTSETITKDTPISLAGWFLDGTSHTPDDVTYEEVLKRITAGGQGALYIADESAKEGLIVTAQIILTDENNNKKVIAEDKYAYIPEPTVDVYTPAEVAAIGEIPYQSDYIEPDTAVKVAFTEDYADVQDKEYKDWTADIIVTFNKDLNAEDVYFFGKFGSSGWLGGPLEGQTINADQAISLVNWFLGGTAYSPSDVTYEEVLKRITTDADAALYISDAAAKAGLVINVQMVLSDGEGHTMVLAEDSYAY